MERQKVEDGEISVTIVVPLFNSGSTLQRAIDSLTNQSLRNIEILIINDGSIDDGPAIAARAASSDPRIRYISFEKNGGKAHVMNSAIGLARGKWLVILDADDEYKHDRLEVLIDYAERLDVDLVADNQIHVDPLDPAITHIAFPADKPGHSIGLDDFVNNSTTSSSFSYGILKPIVRMDFLRRNQIGYFPAAVFAQDFYFLIDFFAASGRAYLASEPLYVWTLPFSSTRRKWTTTGRGAWRYNYENAINTNRAYLEKYKLSGNSQLLLLLRKKGDEYNVMRSYISAQRLFEEKRDYYGAAIELIKNPLTVKILYQRIAHRILKRS